MHGTSSLFRSKFQRWRQKGWNILDLEAFAHSGNGGRVVSDGLAVVVLAVDVLKPSFFVTDNEAK